MNRLSRRTRLILGIASILLCVLLSWALSGVLGGASLFLLLPGAVAFIRLNPELMRGE